MSMNNWPIEEDGIPVTATATSQAVEIAQDSRELILQDVLIDNPGPNDVFVKAGNQFTQATINSVRVPPGSLQPYRKGNTTHLALVCRAGQTQAVVIHVGVGQ